MAGKKKQPDAPVSPPADNPLAPLRAELDRPRIAIAGAVMERSADHASVTLRQLLHCNIEMAPCGCIDADRPLGDALNSKIETPAFHPWRTLRCALREPRRYLNSRGAKSAR